MTHAAPMGSGSRSAMLLLSGATALIAILLALTGAPSMAHASSSNFCSNYYAAPYGKAGDRCNASNAQYLVGATLTTVEHSGCVDGIDNGGNLVTNWQCSAGPNGLVWMNFFPLGGRLLRGIVRNNTTGAYTHVSGGQEW